MTGILLLLQLAAPTEGFAAFARAQEAACAVDPGRTNESGRVAGEQESECLRKRAERAAERPAFEAFRRAEADWTRYVDASCALVEEMFWVDAESGLRSFGTMRGYATIGCRKQASLDRLYLAAAVEAGAPQRMVDRFRERAADDAAAGVAFREWRDGVLHWVAAVPVAPSEAEHPLERDEARRLHAAAVATEGQAEALAEASCRSWPALRDALGGQAACVRATAAATLPHPHD
jgi:hypothetical protein